jgi:hypothetical protein
MHHKNKTMKKIFFLLIAFTVSASVFAQDKMETSNKMENMHGKMQDCVMMENGRMMVLKGGKQMAMANDMTLANGTIVMKDGHVTTKSGKTMMLKNGQCVYMNGKMKMMPAAKMKDSKM